MSGIGVGVEEADGDALDARCRHVLQDRPRAGFIQRFEHLAGGADALPNCLTQRPRNQWWRRTPVDIVDMRLARRAADLKDVAEPLGCDQDDFRRPALHDEVGNTGRRVGKTFNGYLLTPRLLENASPPPTQ